MQRLEFSRFIFFVVFYIDEEKLAASPGAMASPDRPRYSGFILGEAQADTFRRRADAVPPLIWQTTTRARVFVLPGGVGA